MAYYGDPDQYRREAMLRALGQGGGTSQMSGQQAPGQPPPLAPQLPYSYTPGDLTRAPTGAAPRGIGAAAGIAGIAAPQIAKAIAGPPATLYGRTFGAPAGLGMGTSLGIGIGSELLGGALRPKVQQATAGGDIGDYVDQYQRRREGSGEGILGGGIKGAGRGAQIGSFVPGIGTGIGAGIGAAAGAIGNAFTKNAASAYSDFNTNDARQAIRAIYKQEGGRDVSEAEIDTILKGAGSAPQGGFVGEQGLYLVLHNLRNEFLKEQTSPIRQALDQQLGVGGPAPAGGAATGLGPGTSTVDLVNAANQRTGGAGGAGVMAGDQAGAGASVTPSAPAAGPAGGTAAIAGPGGNAQTAAAAQGAGVPQGADTDGYATPGYTVTPKGPAPPGWNQQKWADPNHQTPKYVVGRILAQFPSTPEGLQAALPEIQKAYPGTEISSLKSGKIKIPGVGLTDVGISFGAGGGKGWGWGGGKGKAPADAGATGTASPLLGGGGLYGLGTGASNMAQIMDLVSRYTQGAGPDAGRIKTALVNQLGKPVR